MEGGQYGTSWQKLSDLKGSHPLQVAELVFGAQIANEPAFNFWVSWFLKKRDVLSPWLSTKVLDTTSELTSTGLRFPRL